MWGPSVCAHRYGCNNSFRQVRLDDLRSVAVPQFPQASVYVLTICLPKRSGGQGMIGLPMEAKEVTDEEIEQHFPPHRILEKWYKGEEAEWPEPEPLRFIVNQKVLCRVGPTSWAPGTVQQLWYREPSWPPQSFAPYKIRLDDGRDIFAPADMDQVIRLNPDEPQPLEEIE